MEHLLDALMVLGPLPHLVQPGGVFSGTLRDCFEQRALLMEEAWCQVVVKKCCVPQGVFDSFSSLVF